MAGSLHFEAPTALEYFAALVADDASLPLLEAAVAVAQDEYPRPRRAGRAGADRCAWPTGCKRRIPADAAPLQRLRLLNRYFFQELGFAGNVNDYYDPRNSYLHEVLDTRRGIPITLALLYIELATQVGLTARGVSFPGHFLVKLRMPRGEVVIDPFTGQSLSRDELDERLRPTARQRGLIGDFEVPLGLFLQAAPPRDVLARLLRNLKEIHRSAEDWPRLLAVLRAAGGAAAAGLGRAARPRPGAGRTGPADGAGRRGPGGRTCSTGRRPSDAGGAAPPARMPGGACSEAAGPWRCGAC